MRVSNLASGFFLFYGGLIPILSPKYSAEHPVVTLFTVASCFLIAIMLRARKQIFLSLLLSVYVFRLYLTRPYVDVFLPELNVTQFDYVRSLNGFFNATDAQVVYCSLFTLLLGWALGLTFSRPRRLPAKARIPWLFHHVDIAVANCGPVFWAVWIAFFVMNRQGGLPSWQALSTGEGIPLFAYGFLSLATVNTVCLHTYMWARQQKCRHVSPFLLLPVAISALTSVSHGGRSAVFQVVVLAGTYWMFLNYDKHLKKSKLVRLAVLAVILGSIVMIGGLAAQSVRPLLRAGSGAELISTTLTGNLRLWEPGNPMVGSIYFGVTELLHRASSLEQPFLILNDHFKHIPWDHFNPATTMMRIVNDLLPGEPFATLNINQLFSYIYLDAVPIYRSDMWSIQGTLYLYFGHWLSPIVVFLVARLVAHLGSRLDLAVGSSPTLFTFVALLFNDLIENGTLERVIVVDVGRPLVSLLAFIVLYKLLRDPFAKRVKRADRGMQSQSADFT
jgi:hypothetical protein